MPQSWKTPNKAVPTPSQLRLSLGFVPARAPRISATSGGLTLTGGPTQPVLDLNVSNVLDAISNVQGSVLYRGGAGWAALPPSTAGFVLSTNGPGANPTWIVSGAGSGITQLTGDVTAGPGSGAQAATLAVTGVAAATYGDATHVGQFTVDAKGRITAAANVAITAGGSVGPRQGSVTKPVVASFTSFNFQASTVGVDGVAGIMLTDTVATAANFRFLELTAALPAAPFDIYAHFGFLPNGSQAGITLRSTTTSKFIMMGKNANDFIITVWNSPTSFAGNRLLPAVWSDVSWFRFNVTSTVITCYASYNGLDWFQMFQETIASFLTGPMNKLGIAIQTDTAPIGLLCDSFSFVAPT